MSEKNEDNEVGYGRPPKASRWKPGQSGNRKGRPKGSRNFKTDLAELLSSLVNVTEAGRQRKVTVQKATLMRLGEKALKGDSRAIEKLLELALSLSEESAGQQAERALSGTEEDILARFLNGVGIPPPTDRDGQPREEGHGQ